MNKTHNDFIRQPEGFTVTLARQGAIEDAAHVFEAESIDAVNAALAARRPLLVCGEPGAGKSQLARAAAKALGRAYIPFVVDARTEARDLLWNFDAVARLAQAQVLGALRADQGEVRERLAPENFLHPGPLWWAFDWAGAQRQEERASGRPQRIPFPQVDGGDPECGCVVLVDEIDKAESDVPNGLLEALGAGQFQPEGRDEPVEALGALPLVLITSNAERALPDAFLRRCLILSLTLPREEAFIELMIQRGRRHFKDLKEEVLRAAAELIWEDREKAQREQIGPAPGQAECLDLLRAVRSRHPKNHHQQLETLTRIAAFALGKRRINQG